MRAVLRKNYAKSRRLHTIAQICLTIFSQWRYVLTIGKKRLTAITLALHMSSQYGELRPEISWWVSCTPANFNGFHVLASYCTDVDQQRSATLCMMFGHLWSGTLYVLFWEILPSNGILPGANVMWLCVQVLHSPILAALLHGTQALGVSQTVAWYKECSYGTFAGHFQQRAPPIFWGWPLHWAHILVDHGRPME